MQAGMGERQGRGIDNQIAVKEEIEIKSTLGPTFAADATIFLLDDLQQL